MNDAPADVLAELKRLRYGDEAAQEEIIGRLAARWDAAERDAARYRWLRDKLNLAVSRWDGARSTWYVCSDDLFTAESLPEEYPASIDCAVDAAMERSE